jgi:hypothetical protein
MTELKEGVPAMMAQCPCGFEGLYRFEEVTDFGEAICRKCHDIFWSTKLMDLAHIRKETK